MIFRRTQVNSKKGYKMFMVKENLAQKDRLEKIYKRVKLIYGSLPPQMEFLGNIDAGYLEDFLKKVMKIVKHPNINPNLFAFIRLHIAFKEGYEYCKKFNTKFLLAKGYEQIDLDSAIESINNIPFDSKHQKLASFAIKAIYNSNTCTQKDLEALEALNWTQKDIIDAVEHAGDIFRNGRILSAYSIKA